MFQSEDTTSEQARGGGYRSMSKEITATSYPHLCRKSRFLMTLYWWYRSGA